MKRIFCCYSLNLRKYLTECGIPYDICGLAPNDEKHKMFWGYVRDERLDKALSEWSKNKSCGGK